MWSAGLNTAMQTKQEKSHRTTPGKQQQKLSSTTLISGHLEFSGSQEFIELTRSIPWQPLNNFPFSLFKKCHVSFSCGWSMKLREQLCFWKLQSKWAWTPDSGIPGLPHTQVHYTPFLLLERIHYNGSDWYVKLFSLSQAKNILR